ncbi:MAG TPA: M20/M25/M40 family metallo-hydrolase [Gemmatimonadaceae bacterium]|nr:M20/M25/M40 family metallo-hydrolase [Gemmatimonadaceae bacterium]
MRISSTSALLSAVIALSAGAQTRQTGFTAGSLTTQQQLTRDIYKQLIEINSGDRTGSVTPAAVAMAQRFRDAGIPDADIFIGGPRPEKHNVVARIRGRAGSPRKPLLLLAHIDVVEALKADWSADLDPFVFTERDGYYYGRGTADDKAMAAIFVANAIRMKREGYAPDRDVIVALTADEEGGTANGVDWLLKNHRELVDAGVVLNEGGGGTLRDGKPFFNSVQATEKVFQNVTLRATNRGGHSSVPRADNAITSLADALARVGRYRFPVQFNEVTRAFFTRTADVEAPEMGRAMRALVANPRDTAAERIVAGEPRYNSMLRTTCVATLLKGGHAENALPQLAEANVNCRMFPGDTPEGTRAALAQVVNDTVVQVLVDRDVRPPEPPTPLLPEVMEPITRITHDMFGSIPVIPVMSTGATDSRYFRQLGIPAFGVSGLFSDPAVDARAHGRDERMAVKSFYEGQEFLWRLTKALADRPAVTP